MKKLDAIKYFGGISKLAAALNVSPSSASQWGEYIPKGRAYEIEIKTGGKLKYTPKPEEYKQAS
jgi:DNA-binding transcriptional regulator YdaS (Cro superfamily)